MILVQQNRMLATKFKCPFLGVNCEDILNKQQLQMLGNTEPLKGIR